MENDLEEMRTGKRSERTHRPKELGFGQKGDSDSLPTEGEWKLSLIELALFSGPQFPHLKNGTS